MGWLRRVDAWVRAHPGRVDLAAGLFFALLCVLFTTASYGATRSWSTIGELTADLGIGAAITFRRRRPFVALWIAVATGLLQFFAVQHHSLVSFFIPWIAYSVTAYGTRLAARLTLFAALLAALLGTWMIVREEVWTTPQEFVVVLIGHLLVCAVAIVAGDLTRARRLALQAVADRAERLEQEQEQERALAAADERRRIAREMHDVVAHSLSVIIAQADGARYAAAADSDVAPRTLGTIAETGRSALQEMRSLLGVLRSDDDAAPKAPAPDLSQLPQLVENAHRSGLEVAFTERGTPARALPSGAELAAFRAAQEALTNVLKHAGAGAAAALDLTWTPRGLALTVTDDGRGPTGTDGRGRGQQGMRERAELYGGSATFGPRTGGGYSVSVFLPYQEI